MIKRIFSIVVLCQLLSCQKQEEKFDEVYLQYQGKYSWAYTIQQVGMDYYYDLPDDEDHYYFLLTLDKRFELYDEGELTHKSGEFIGALFSPTHIGFSCEINDSSYSFNFYRNPDNNLWEDCGHHSLFDDVPCYGIQSFFKKVE